jgi:hypothetical protein
LSICFLQEFHDQVANAAKEQHTASGKEDSKTEEKACPQVDATIVISQLLSHAAESISLCFSLCPEHCAVPPFGATDFFQRGQGLLD